MFRRIRSIAAARNRSRALRRIASPRNYVPRGEVLERRLPLTLPELSLFVDSWVVEGTTIAASISTTTMAEEPFSVDFSIIGLTATPTDDYYLAGAPPEVFSGTISFAAMEMWAEINITIVSDSVPENAETFRIQLSNPVNATLSTNDQAIVEISAHNFGPTTTDIFDEYRWVEDDQELQIALSSHFGDMDHALSELTWDLTLTGSSAVSSAWIDGSQVLHVQYSVGTPGQNNIKIRATDPLGEYAESDFDLWSVAVTDIDLELKTDAGWVPVDPSSEVLWDDDELRWTAHILPDDPSLAVSTEWLASPWPGEYYTGGAMFAGNMGLDPAVGNPGMGHHAITPRVSLPNGMTAAFLQAPKEVIVASIVSVEWKQHDYGDGKTDYVPNGNLGHGGDAIFAEKPTPDAGEVLHDKIDVEVKIAWGGGERPATNVFLKVFDPDHDASDPNHDSLPNDPRDNIATGGTTATPGAGLPGTLAFPGTEDTNRVTMTISHLRPGNNFLVATSGREERINNHVDFSNGTTLRDDVTGADVRSERKTTLLTVWRTLHIEEDSMAAPPPTEDFDGPGMGNDDADPQNLGTNGGAGDFVQPGLDKLIDQFIPAHVKVEPLSGTYDLTDDAVFVRNLDDSTYGDIVRDVPTSQFFWTVQIFAAYEWRDDSDHDGPLDVASIAGITRETGPGPANVFLETIRDVTATPHIPPYQDAERMRQRTVLHETMHRFGHAAHDFRVMNYEIAWHGSDSQIVLNGAMRREIESEDPM